MGIWQNIKDFFTIDEMEEPPHLGMEAMATMEAQPVTFANVPTVGIERQLGRLLTLYRVKNKTNDVLDSIDAYREGVAKLGYEPPLDEQATLDLIEQLKG